MGSTLNVNLCPHKVWREKYGCSKCDAEAACERCRGTGYVVTPEGRSWCTCENGKRVSSVGAR